MSWSAPIKLRPTAADLAISRACLRVATPAVERPLRVVTWLADEKIMLGAVGLFWAATRFSASRPLRREADAVLCSVLIAGVVPGLFKYLVRRERPNHAWRGGMTRAWRGFAMRGIRSRRATPCT